jgi:hypothetical protein
MYQVGSSPPSPSSTRSCCSSQPNHATPALRMSDAGAGLKRLAYRTEEFDPAMLAYLKRLDEKKPVVRFVLGRGGLSLCGCARCLWYLWLCSLHAQIWVGDLNVAYHDMDIHAPKSNRNKSAGFTDSERINLGKVMVAGFCDVWREANPTLQQFTYWGYRFGLRGKNKGWRLDYCLVSERFKRSITNSFVRFNMPGSDHVPVGVEFLRDENAAAAAAAAASGAGAGGGKKGGLRAWLAGTAS